VHKRNKIFTRYGNKNDQAKYPPRLKKSREIIVEVAACGHRVAEFQNQIYAENHGSSIKPIPRMVGEIIGQGRKMVVAISGGGGGGYFENILD
jgi:hypothetical protein